MGALISTLSPQFLEMVFGTATASRKGGLYAGATETLLSLPLHPFAVLAHFPPPISKGATAKLSSSALALASAWALTMKGWGRFNTHRMLEPFA